MTDEAKAERAAVSKEEFCARFKARLLTYAEKFADGYSVAKYADDVAPTYWETDWQREDGPEECADSDFHNWEI